MSASPSAASAAHLTGEWARLLLATLRDAGVRDVWVSPGSRSTPFVWAARSTPGLTLRSVIDERSAGFLALGQARVSGRPSALLCTSGSAAANYFPAVVEAAHAHLPLLVLTADRPLEVQQSGAAQTMDQVELYGSYARSFYDLGLPDATPSALSGLRRQAAQAVENALGPDPGPVHLNLRARKPLEPKPAQSEAEGALSQRVTELLARPLTRLSPRAELAPEAIRVVSHAISSAASGAIVVGPLPAYGQPLAEPLAELSRRTGYPLLAEASSQVRFALGDHQLAAPLFDWLLASPALSPLLRPELLLCVGQTPTSSAYERWAAGVPRRLVLAPHGFPDALGTAELVASGNLERGLAALLRELAEHRARPSAFATTLRAAHERCRALVAGELERPGPPLSEGQAVQSAVEAMPDDALLVLGNSLPIRDVDGYVTHARRLRVASQRGLSGIDGLVSGAIGSALCAAAPTLLLLGDVSLQHDLGGLAAAKLLTTPLVIAVVDNAGGRIFEQLPVRELYAQDAAAAELWLTPPGRDLARVADLFGLAYAAPESPEAIRAAVAEGLAEPRVTLLRLAVEPSSASQTRKRVLEALGEVRG